MDQQPGSMYPKGEFDALAVLHIIASRNIVRGFLRRENLTFVAYFFLLTVDPPPPYSPGIQPAPIGFQSPPAAGPPPFQQQQPVSVTVYQPEPVATTNVVVMAPTCPACQVRRKSGLVTKETISCGRLLMSH